MNSQKKVRVLVVDDSAMFRRAVISGLSLKDNIEIVGEAADVFEARDKIMQLKPDVLVLDIVMPKMDGLTFLKQLMGQYPVPCVMISGTADEANAIAAGAADFVAKPKSPADQKMSGYSVERFAPRHDNHCCGEITLLPALLQE